MGYTSWNGLPGSGLGGMAPKTVTPRIWQVGSEQNSYAELKNVPMQTRSTKSFFGREYHHCSDWMHTQLSDEEGIPVGTIEVSDDFLRFALQNCILVYGRWALELGDITPGQTITITKTTPRRDLRDLLIPPKTLENADLRGLATYNPQSTDLEYIVRVMSLHRALGGYESTGLHHAYMPSLDMSDLLSADRVLLLGTMESAGTSWTHWSRSTSFFRVSLPIELTESSPRLGGKRSDSVGGALDSPIKPEYIKVPGGEQR
jgi:hypothetical protein